MNQWTENAMPDLQGKCALVTGANSGLGFASARALAAKGAKVLLGCRDLHKGQEALERIQEEILDSQLQLVQLDLANLDSIAAAARSLDQSEQRLDILINNAGVMMPPYTTTEEGFELQFGTNHLGHFALTGRLFPLLRQTPGSRVVTVSSLASHRGSIRFHDLHWEATYDDWKAYAQSKLANVMFALELEDRLRRHQIPVTSLAAHPGFSSTNLFTDQLDKIPAALRYPIQKWIVPAITQSAKQGAWPQLFAATAPEMNGSLYFGPRRYGEMFGYPKPARIPAQAHDKRLREKLWAVSSELTGVTYPLA